MRSAETVLGIIHDHDLRSWRALESRVLRKAQARFGEGRLEKCRKRQLVGSLLYVMSGSARARGCDPPAPLTSSSASSTRPTPVVSST